MPYQSESATMKKSTFAALCLIFLVASCKNVQKVSEVSNSSLESYLSYPLDKNLGFISVHRGGGELAGNPENCIESFDFFSKQFPVIIECDIAMTSDKQLIMMHDESVDRTTNGTGKVTSLTAAEVTKLKLKDNKGNLTDYNVPTLEHVLQWAKGNAIVTLDYKKSTPLKSLIELIEKTNTERNVVVITYNADEAAKVYQLNPTLKISVGIMQIADYERLRSLGIPDKNMIAFIGTREPKKELIDFLHEKGIATILGSLGNLDKKALNSSENLYKKWRTMGVDIFATDYPIEAYKKLTL